MVCVVCVGGGRGLAWPYVASLAQAVPAVRASSHGPAATVATARHGGRSRTPRSRRHARGGGGGLSVACEAIVRGARCPGEAGQAAAAGGVGVQLAPAAQGAAAQPPAAISGAARGGRRRGAAVGAVRPGVVGVVARAAAVGPAAAVPAADQTSAVHRAVARRPLRATRATPALSTGAGAVHAEAPPGRGVAMVRARILLAGGAAVPQLALAATAHARAVARAVPHQTG